jgi:hypothetical protein
MGLDLILARCLLSDITERFTDGIGKADVSDNSVSEEG